MSDYKRRGPSPRQAELDRWAWRNGWERAPYRTWWKDGFTVGVSANGGFVVSKDGDSREVSALDEVAEVCGGRSRVSG